LRDQKWSQRPIPIRRLLRECRWEVQELRLEWQRKVRGAWVWGDLKLELMSSMLGGKERNEA
jgi:hypothetical protein